MIRMGDKTLAYLILFRFINLHSASNVNKKNKAYGNPLAEKQGYTILQMIKNIHLERSVVLF
jgi:hypothetical protein